MRWRLAISRREGAATGTGNAVVVEGQTMDGKAVEEKAVEGKTMKEKAVKRKAIGFVASANGGLLRIAGIK